MKNSKKCSSLYPKRCKNYTRIPLLIKVKISFLRSQRFKIMIFVHPSIATIFPPANWIFSSWRIFRVSPPKKKNLREQFFWSFVLLIPFAPQLQSITRWITAKGNCNSNHQSLTKQKAVWWTSYKLLPSTNSYHLQTPTIYELLPSWNSCHWKQSTKLYAQKWLQATPYEKFIWRTIDEAKGAHLSNIHIMIIYIFMLP